MEVVTLLAAMFASSELGELTLRIVNDESRSSTSFRERTRIVGSKDLEMSGGNRVPSFIPVHLPLRRTRLYVCDMACNTC